MGGSGKRVKDVDKIEKEKAEAVDQKKEKPKRVEKQIEQFSIVRVSGTDLNGDKPLGLAMTKIKGISWAMSNAICLAGGFDSKKPLKELSEADIHKIEDIIKEPVKHGIPIFMVNRKRDLETGKDLHLSGSDLDVAVKFDIQRHVDLKTYRGWRHMLGQPVRGQRTRSKFRVKGRIVGVLKKGVKAAAAPAAGTGPAAVPAKKE